MRIDKFLADGASLTRSEARKKIKQGCVRVEGETVKDIAFQLGENNNVTLDGEKITYKRFVYIMLNKPAGYISATEDKKKKTVLELISPSYFRFNLFPAGRLDIDTEGFLLLTNDGNLTHNILAPNKNVGKTYFVRLETPIYDEEINALEKGVDIGECITKPAQVVRLSENELHLTITEGKFHQIKRMAHSVNNSVIYLKRMAYANLWLDESLKIGEYRELTQEEVDNLYNIYKRKN